MVGDAAVGSTAHDAEQGPAPAATEPETGGGIEERVTGLFANDARLTLTDPGQTYNGRDEIREAVQQLLALRGIAGSTVETNDAGQITSLSLPPMSGPPDRSSAG